MRKRIGSIVYAFIDPFDKLRVNGERSRTIDSQNLNLGVRDQGWKLDFGRFLVYLRDKIKKRHSP